MAEVGQAVVFILCYDTFDHVKKKHINIRKEEHFLFNSLLERFAGTAVKLEFVDVRKVLEHVSAYAAQRVNVFVDEFSFACKTFDIKIRKEITACTVQLKLPRVTAGAAEMSTITVPNCIKFLSSITKDISHFIWIAGKDAEKIRGLPSPKLPLTQQLRCSEQISMFAQKETTDVVSKGQLLLLPGLNDCTRMSNFSWLQEKGCTSVFLALKQANIK